MVSTAEKIRMLKGRYVFPDLMTVAECRFRSQAITLETIRKSQFENIQQPSDLVGSRQVLTTIFHEITHWCDLTGTLWGRRYLRQVYATYPVLDRLKTSGAETEFYRLVSLHDQARRFALPQYYLVKEGQGELGKPEEGDIRFTGGIEFNTAGRPDKERPIVFVRFQGKIGNLSIRQPLREGALLEAIAVWSELQVGNEVVSEMDAEPGKVEEAEIARGIGALLADADLTLYTAPVRMLAHFAKPKSYIVAYQMAAQLAFVCLNLGSHHFKALKHPPLMTVWGDRNQQSKRNLDAAYAFAAICISAGRLGHQQSAEDWVNVGLRACGLPAASKILAEALSAMEREGSVPPSKWSKQANYVLEAGLEIAKSRVAASEPAITWNRASSAKLPLPPMIDADMVQAVLPFSTFDTSKFDTMEMIDAEYRLDDETTNFISACR